MREKDTISAKGFIKSIAGFSMSTWISAVINIAVVPITTRLYDGAQLGSIELFTTTLNLISMLVTLGIDQAYMRYYNEPPGGISPKQLLTRCVTITLLVWLTISAGILFFRDSISMYIADVSGSFIAVLLIGNLLATTIIRFLNLAYRMQDNVLGFTLQAVMMVFFSKAFYVTAAFFDPTYRGAILVNTLTMVGLAGIYFILQRKNFDKTGMKPQKSVDFPLLSYSLPLMPVAIFTWLNDSAAKYLIKFYSDNGLADVAVFSSAAKLTSILSLVQTGFNIYWVSFVYQHYKTEQQKIRSIHNYITAIMMLMSVGVVAFEDVIFLFLGKDVRGGMVYFPFLLITPVLHTISETTCIGINISKKTGYHILTSGLSMLINLLLCILLIPRYGGFGGAIAVGGSGLVMYITRTIFGQKYYKSIISKSVTAFSSLVFIVFCSVSSAFTGQLLIRLAVSIITALIFLFLYKQELFTLYKILLSILRHKRQPVK